MESSKRQPDHEYDWNQTSVSGFDFSDLASTVQQFGNLGSGSVISEDLDRIEDCDWQGTVTSASTVAYSSGNATAELLSPPMHKAASAPASVRQTVKFVNKEVETSPADVRRLEMDNKRLRNELSRYETSKFRSSTGNAPTTVRRIIMGQEFHLEPFKSKGEKMNLLSTAIEYGDGAAITIILVFLQKTLTFDLFLQVLMHDSIAANHYISYLKQSSEYAELTTMLRHLGRKEEAAIVDFYLATHKTKVGEKLAALKRCCDTSFKADPSLAIDGLLVTEYVDLLERQVPVDAADDKTSQEGKDPKFNQAKKVVSLIDQPVLITLYYCCLYHYDTPSTHLGSPFSLRKRHQLTDKQFIWTAVKALARFRRWAEIEGLLTDKNLFGSAKLKTVIPFKKLVDILSRHNPPSEVVAKYISLIPDSDVKLSLAKQHKCHNLVIEALVQSKDKQSLIDYRNTLAHNSPEYIHAENHMERFKAVKIRPTETEPTGKIQQEMAEKNTV